MFYFCSISMKNLIFFMLFCFLFFVGWCAEQLDRFNESVDTVRNSEEYQQVKQSVNSWVKYVWDKTNQFIESNTWAQNVINAANQTLDMVAEKSVEIGNQAQDMAKEMWEKAQEKAKEQYEILKEETKASVKEVINQKVDEAFDKF